MYIANIRQKKPATTEMYSIINVYPWVLVARITSYFPIRSKRVGLYIDKNLIKSYYLIQGVVTLNPKRKSAPESIAVFLCVKFVISYSFFIDTHISNSYLCREGGEYNTRKGNNPGRSLFRFTNLLATLLGQIFVK